MEKMESERLYIKLLTEAAVNEKYISWHNNEAHLKYYSSSKKKFTREYLVDEINEGHKKGLLFTYGLYTKENEKLIGNIKIGPISKKHMTSDLVVFIGDTDYLGKGLAVEGIKLGNQAAFNAHSVRKLFGGMFRGNIASVKAYTRADWMIEGILEGQYLVDGKSEDRILVACFNPELFDVAKIMRNSLKIEDVYEI